MAALFFSFFLSLLLLPVVLLLGEIPANHELRSTHSAQDTRADTELLPAELAALVEPPSLEAEDGADADDEGEVGEGQGGGLDLVGGLFGGVLGLAALAAAVVLAVAGRVADVVGAAVGVGSALRGEGGGEVGEGLGVGVGGGGAFAAGELGGGEVGFGDGLDGGGGLFGVVELGHGGGGGLEGEFG